VLNPQLLPRTKNVTLNQDPQWKMNAALLSLDLTVAIGVDLESLPIKPELGCKCGNFDYHAPTVEEETGLNI
jgi:hypothetical protein